MTGRKNCKSVFILTCKITACNSIILSQSDKKTLVKHLFNLGAFNEKNAADYVTPVMDKLEEIRLGALQRLILYLFHLSYS